MKIAVLGGGNGSYAAAADLAELGHEVRFWRRDREAFASTLHAQRIELKDFRGQRSAALNLATTDLGQAVKGAALLVVPTPAFAQEDIARALAPHLSDGQVIFLPPGTFGSYVMARTLRNAGCLAQVAIAETGTLPWLTRKHGPNQVAITTRASRLPTGVFPARSSAAAFEVLRAAFPAIDPIEDALSGALMNAGPIIHPPLIIMNAGPIEHFERWDIHKEGTQPSIRRVTDVLDGERIAAREALGYRAPHFPLKDHYTSDRWMYGNLAHDKLVDSGDWKEKLDLRAHRYMVEDVGCGLAFLVSVCEWAGVACPVARGLLEIGAAVTGKDFYNAPRTLRGLGLAGMTHGQMRSLLHDGL
jgi:opine dehydrogenase